MIMDNTPLRNLLTIVIPSKNEGMNLYHTVSSIASQYQIEGIRVIIADCSDQFGSIHILNEAISNFKHKLNIELIEGGYPAYGRYVGAKLVETPYILFLDADIILIDRKVLYDTVHKTTHLTSVQFHTDPGYNWIYKIFYTIQKMMKFFGSSFAIGGFQLFRTDIYNYTGGYNPKHMFAEDYYVSNKIHSQFFTLHNTKGVYTSSRRFRKKGLFYMVTLMFKCWLNRNNETFYMKSHGYWN